MQLRLRNSDFINRSGRDANEFPASNTQPSLHQRLKKSYREWKPLSSISVRFRCSQVKEKYYPTLAWGRTSEHVHGEIKLEGGHNLESFDFFGLKGPITKYFFLNTNNC